MDEKDPFKKPKRKEDTFASAPTITITVVNNRNRITKRIDSKFRLDQSKDPKEQQIERTNIHFAIDHILDEIFGSWGW